MANQNNSFKLWKAVFEARYSSTAAIFDNRGKIASEWQFKDDLSEWRISNNAVVVHNKSNTTLLSASHDSIIVSQELPRGLKDFNNTTLEFASSVFQLLKPRLCSRFGLRVHYIAERKSFKALVRKIGERLYRLDDEDWKVFGGFPEDVGLTLIWKQDNNTVRYRFGPMEKRQYQEDNLFASEEAIEKLPRVSLFVDFDYISHNPTGGSPQELTKQFLSQGREAIEGHIESFHNRFGEL